jgi:hypothetical protein
VENGAHYLRNISSLRAKCLIAKLAMKVFHRLFHSTSTFVVDNNAACVAGIMLFALHPGHAT